MCKDSLGYLSCSAGFSLMSEAVHRSKGRFRDAVELRFRVLQRDALHVGEELRAEIQEEELLHETNFLILFLDKARNVIAEGSIRYRTASKG